MTHPPDELLPNSRTQALKALLLGEQVTEPWYMRFVRSLGSLFVPAWRTR